MRGIRVTINGVAMKRVTKPVAEKQFNTGAPVFIVPCKVNPNNVWGIGCFANRESFPDTEFEDLVNNYTYYSCNSEMGYYPSYYIVA